jgi:hypothetical protein
MRSYTWNDAKNELLHQSREISFENIVEAIATFSLGTWVFRSVESNFADYI